MAFTLGGGEEGGNVGCEDRAELYDVSEFFLQSKYQMYRKFIYNFSWSHLLAVDLSCAFR